MFRLAEQLDVSCLISVRDGDEIVVLDIAGDTQPAHLPMRVGRRVPLTAALGSVYYAWAPIDVIEKWISESEGQFDLEPAERRHALAVVRSRGYSLGGERDFGLRLDSVLRKLAADDQNHRTLEIAMEVADLIRSRTALDSDGDGVDARVNFIIAPIFDASGQVGHGVHALRPAGTAHRRLGRRPRGRAARRRVAGHRGQWWPDAAAVRRRGRSLRIRRNSSTRQGEHVTERAVAIEAHHDIGGAIGAAVERAIREHGEIGLQVAAVRDGTTVVDVAGGVADVDSRTPVTSQSLFPVFSVTKGVVAALALRLLGDGTIDLGTPLAEIWPEFGAHGKGEITLEHALTHSAGIPQMPDGVTPEVMCDWEQMCRLVADLEPLWHPGTQAGYHSYTYGWIVGEALRRALRTDASVGLLVRELITIPERRARLLDRDARDVSTTAS